MRTWWSLLFLFVLAVHAGAQPFDHNKYPLKVNLGGETLGNPESGYISTHARVCDMTAIYKDPKARLAPGACKLYAATCDHWLPTNHDLEKGNPRTTSKGWYFARWKKQDLELRLLTTELGMAGWQESVTCKVSPE